MGKGEEEERFNCCMCKWSLGWKYYGPDASLRAHFSIHDSRLQCTRTIPHVGSHSIAALHSTFSVPALQVRKR
eukprot:15347031-Ditylum_brightwellii.AAC.1